MRFSWLPFGHRPFVVLSFLSIVYTQLAYCAGPDDWRTRSIYQIVTDRFAHPDGSTTAPCNPDDFEYCGGTFKGIIKQLDYIQGMGFTAIWISPVVKGIENSTVGAGYHGFWQQDLTSINHHFGTDDDLKDLAQALHARGMYLMIDILVNNMASPGPGQSVDYAAFSPPFNNKAKFHTFCAISNYTDPTNYQNCWLGNDKVSLPDINTEDPEVQTYFDNWSAGLVSNFSVDGLRIDAAKHVPKAFWKTMQTRVPTYMIGEVFTTDTTIACDYMDSALDGVLNYPLLYGIGSVFGYSQNNASDMGYYLQNQTESCHDATLLGTFTENHDVQRLASVTNDTAQLASALVFAITGDGIPIVYYGSEQGLAGIQDPYNRQALWLSGYDTSNPLYRAVRAANFARSSIVNASAHDNSLSPYWKMKSKLVLSDPNTIIVRKGYSASMVTLMTNKGVGSKSLGPYDVGDTNWEGSVEITEVLGCTKQTTGQYGAFTTSLKDGQPQIWVPTKYLDPKTLSEICPSIKALPQSAKSAASRRGGAAHWWIPTAWLVVMSILML